MRDRGSRDAFRMRILQSSQLHGEIPDRRTLYRAASYLQARRSFGQPIQKRVAATTADDINPPQLLSANLRKLAHDLPVPGGEAMQNEARHFRRPLRTLRDGLHPAPLELPVDTRRHLPGQEKLR